MIFVTKLFPSSYLLAQSSQPIQFCPKLTKFFGFSISNFNQIMKIFCRTRHFNFRPFDLETIDFKARPNTILNFKLFSKTLSRFDRFMLNLILIKSNYRKITQPQKYKKVKIIRPNQKG